MLSVRIVAEFLVRGDRGDDLRAFDGVFRRLADGHVEAGVRQIAGQPHAGLGRKIIGPDLGDAEQLLEG